MVRRAVTWGASVVAALSAIAVSASAAGATTYYASPTGTATSGCTTSSNPCDLTDAVNNVPTANGDEVVVESGTYNLGSTALTAGKAINIHGVAGEPLPVIEGSATSGTFLLTLNGGSGTVVSDLELLQQGTNGPPSALWDKAGGATIEDVVAQAPGVAVDLGPQTLLRDSVARNTEAGNAAVFLAFPGTARVENVTAYGVGAGIGVTNLGSGAATIVAENVIAHGGQADLSSTTEGSGTATLQIGYSNYSFTHTVGTIDTGEGHNQNAATSPPLLVNPSAGDFHEQPGSPTVDAGIDDSFLGPSDLDGHPRILGAGPDIGAYELPVPLVSTGAASGLTLTGHVDPEGVALTSCSFQYGTSTTYDHSAPCTPAGTGDTTPFDVSATLSGLSPHATYHYRLTAANGDGTATGSDETFTTPPLPASSSPPAISGTARSGHRLTCSMGRWTGSPTAFKWQWYRDGTAIPGASSQSYTVQQIDEGSTLSCKVTATNLSGSRSSSSRGVRVPVPVVTRCPPATGGLFGSRLGLLRLGMTRAQAHRVYSHSASRGKAYQDFFCLTPRGLRVGYASPLLLRSLPKSERARLAGRVVWISTSNPFYAIDGIRFDSAISVAAARLHTGAPYRIGLNLWYLGHFRGTTVELKVRQGIVEEVGIADGQLVRTRREALAFLNSFG